MTTNTLCNLFNDLISLNIVTEEDLNEYNNEELNKLMRIQHIVRLIIKDKKDMLTYTRKRMISQAIKDNIMTFTARTLFTDYLLSYDNILKLYESEEWFMKEIDNVPIDDKLIFNISNKTIIELDREIEQGMIPNKDQVYYHLVSIYTHGSIIDTYV